MLLLKMAAPRKIVLGLTAILLCAIRCLGGPDDGKAGSPLTFTHHLYNTTINENSAPRTYVEAAVKMGIEITDVLWEIEYKVVSGDDDGIFQAEAVKVGDFDFLRIKTRSSDSALLNREVRDSYSLTVEATESTFDYQTKTKVFVQVLDMNDLKPLFYPASYDVVIREDTPLQSSVVTVSATDADVGSNAKFYYSFTLRAHPFVVDPFTGTVSLYRKLNHTRAGRYDLTVLAEDRTKKISGHQKFGNVARVTVNVQKTSSGAPVITAAPKPTFSADGKITINVHVEAKVKPVESLHIIKGDPHKCFEIIPLGPQGTDFQVVSTKRIIWPQTPFGLNLSLQAKDRSLPSLLSPVTRIHVPAYDYIPLSFLEDTYIVSLSEYSPVKSHVLKVSISSYKHNVTFSIKNNPDSAKFMISPKTGIIITTGKFDYERKRRYEFDVVANQAETHVVVEIKDENDNSPQFEQTSYEASLDENSPVGTSVLKVIATDRDKGKNGFVTYAFADSGPLPFTIDPFSGIISTSEHMDYELMKRRYHLRVWASDSGTPFSRVSECPVTLTMININDNIPLFETVDCNATISVDTPAGHTVVELSAIDLDELQQIRYVIESGNELQLFTIDSDSGSVTLKHPIPKTVGSFTLRVVASDGRHRSEASIVRITVVNKNDEATHRCHETGINKQLIDKLIKSSKQVLNTEEEDAFSDIHITNRHSPKFDKSNPKSINVPEDHPIGTKILSITATDEDTGFNSMPVYAIASGNEDGCFRIDTFSGLLQLVCLLDRELKEFYVLNITVSDLGTPQRSSRVLLVVNVIDVNDNPPTFDQPRHVIRIPENTEMDSVIFTARAIDEDTGASGTFQYTLLTSNDLFRVDETTGEVVVTGRLDRETTPRHDLLIQAKEKPHQGPQLFSTLELVVVLQDINDNPPKFVPKVYKIKVPEDIPVGTLLLWLESLDLDLGSGGLVTYNLKNTEGDIFHLDSSTGALILEKELDFERRVSYNLTVRAVDHGLPRSLSSSCFVEIEVLDVNENLYRPAFSEFVYEAGVMEDSVVGTSVVTLTASDKDLGRDGVVRYHIHEGSGLGVFTIDEETGVIRTKEALDRETRPHYWLSVYVTDLGTEPLVSWTHVFLEVLDVNDNAPQLSQPIYFAAVPENVPQVKSVLQVSATDLDTISENKLSFQMLPSHRMYFNIEAKTGVISTVSVLDREDKPEHSIEVIVSDNGSPPLRSTATVVIKVLDANDNAPKFTDKRFHVMMPAPNLQPGQQEVCRMIAGDADEGPNAAVTYKIHQDQDSMFEIDPVTGVVTSQGRFFPGNYSIVTIKATDQGKPPKSSTARLDIEWIAIPPPSHEPITFEEPQFTLTVIETEAITYMVGIIRTETHRQQWFDIEGGDEDKDFDIHRNTGAISVARRLDAARRSNYNLTVRVTDGHQAATTQAYIRVVDMNEHRPVFLKQQYKVRVPEDTAPWKDILQVGAQDQDGSEPLVFSIQSSVHPNSTKLFHLDPKSGVLVMTEALDYEAISVHTLIVMVREEKLLPVKRNFVKVVIHVEDCNDHSPAFLRPRYEANFSNLVPVGSEVIRVKALDMDTGSNADIRYSLHSGNIDNMFSIDPLLGSISPSKPLDLQPQQQFHLTVKATDQGFPQRSDICSVHLLIHTSEQMPPAFPSEDYLTEVSESSVIGTSVVTISASSPAAVHYGIENGNQGDMFHINPFTGLISVQKPLDFEKQVSYVLKVTASTTAGARSRTSVYVYVIDENDNAPLFEQQEYLGEISESSTVNTMVMREKNIPLVVKASDVDKDINSLLVYEILDPEASKIFKIDPSMGTIALISRVDFETKAEYEFLVQAKDSGQPPLYTAEPAKVTIRVLDLNDCPPHFTNSIYDASIIFPPVTDAEVVHVTAHDPDSTVTYSIAEGNLHGAFSIKPDSGVVTVSNTSDFRHVYQLVVRASDGLYNTLAIVNVNVTNVTTSSLRFEHKVYSVSVMENKKKVKVLAALKPIGCFLNEPLLFSLVNPMGRFSISATSGILETTGIPFDREERDVYDVMVKLQDMRTPARTDMALVKVSIEDANDNPPQFQNLPFSVMISEDLEPGDVLYQATAVDRDFEENGAVVYSLEEDYELFRIHPDEGDISLQRPIDFEALNKYVLTVWAEDEGNPSHKTKSELSIQVRNRTNPVFQTLVYPLKVSENVPPFTTILHVQARNPEGYRLVYNLEDENATKHFHMDFKTGVLTVTNPLDYESQRMHVLTVRASDSVTGAFSEASIEIEVDDVNDNAPMFSKPSYSVNIAEGLPIDTSVIQVSASDLDSGRNKDLTFKLVGMTDEEAQLFKMEPKSGLIVTKGALDHESRKTFILKVRVTDNGTVSLSSEGTVFVNVTDVNDNPPDFISSLYEANLDEMANCGHIVVKVQASDPDIADVNHLKYKILSGNEDRYFNINESSGIISFSNVCKRNLDPYYNLTVAVSDGVFQKKAPVNIDMINTNRHSPYFKQSIYEAELAENAEAGTRVIRLAAIDPDDGQYGSVDYTIINKLADDKFDIDDDGHIITRQPLDRENPAQRVIAIKVMAKDGGGKVAFCTVKIILTDENDNVPQFKASEYQVSIQSTVNKGSPVIQIMAYDADDGKNADVTYTVDEAEEVTEDIIEINPFSGVVSVKESLVGMENKIFHFKVKARDGSFPFYNSTVPVKVKVVPPEVPLPKFSEPLYSFSAAEDVPVGTEIGSIKANSDMPLIYSLVDGNTVESNQGQVFSMDQESGTLVLQKTIDHEKTKWYQIDVIAQGNHNGTDVASLVSVSIQVQDVNDNQPMFDANPYRAFLAENMPAGTTVIQVTANDPDTETNGLVTYSLEPLPGGSDDIMEVFSIDGDSGWITTMRETDCELNRVYKFNVQATDHGSDVKLSSSVLVEVTVTDENDNPPKFSSKAYQGSVMENSGPGEVIISMATTDADVSLENRLVTCYITDGDPLGQFAIVQEDEGKWGLIVKEPLDRENKEKYSLKITATDGKFETPVRVEVRVRDVNDNSPVCDQLLYRDSVMENSPTNTFVSRISASDADLETNSQISYSLHGAHSNKFRLDRSTGKLSTVVMLDREDILEYKMVAKATDGGGLFCQVNIHLLVQDANDNPPHFSSSRYPVTMFDNTTVRTPIAVLYAKDPDSGINSEVKYSILTGDGGYFSVDEFSGVVRLERPITSDTPPTFELKVKATDRGFPRNLFSIATVTVDVVSLDDYQPVFLNSEHTVQLLESLEVGSEVLSVSALTRDGGGPEPVRYRIIAGNEDQRFHLHQRTGLLTLNAPLDFENSREFYLSVEGSRGKSTSSDITTIIINVRDVNDNTPVFQRGDYSAEISEDMASGSLVMKVIATDKDGPVNNLLRYSIVSGDPLQQFTIHPRSGEITVCAPLDREEIPHYSLTVQAADEGEPPLSSAVLISITVTDANDNPPVFSQVNHSLLLQEGESVGSSFLQLVVTDKDTPKNGAPFSFHIISGNEDRRFQVDQGGLLSLYAPLKKKVKPHHQLKVQVTDSGHPPLSSICVIDIDVVEQSKYPPTVVPLEVFITTVGGMFANRVIGRLHASDQDRQDILTYKLMSENPAGGHFSVDQADGKIWADDNLEEGSYSLNVSVTDGKFIVWTGVKVHVWAATQKVLDSGVTLQLGGMTPEEFLGDHWRGFQRSLGQDLGLPKQELHLASLQTTPNTKVLEVLLVWRPLDGPLLALPTSKLAGKISDIGESLDLNILRVYHNGCPGSWCPRRGCRNAVHLHGERLSHFTTARAGYITPPHTWESVCPCNESAVAFDDTSYLRYLHQMDEDNHRFTLSLRFKTFHEDGLIMLANGTDWGILQLLRGALHFSYKCEGVASGEIAVRSASVSDGGWHTVLLEVNSTSVRLTLDQHHPASSALSQPCRMMRSHSALLFASVPQEAPEKAKSHPRGFIGCLEKLELNREPIRVGDVAEWSEAGYRRTFGVYQCCSRAGACVSNPCQHGGVCEEDTSGEPRCRCAGLFHGARCELPENPCASHPCTNGRVCEPKGQGYICNCAPGDPDARCHNQLVCLPNSCPRGYECQASHGSFHCDPLPQVSPGFGYTEILGIGGSILGLLFIVAIFVCIRKRYVQQRHKKPIRAEDTNGYFHSTKKMKPGQQEVHPIELTSLMGPVNDLDHTPFRSLRPRSQIVSSGGMVSSQKNACPVVCSVAPNLPNRPPSSSDNDSIRKGHWDQDYEVYPADPDYYGRPSVQEFPQFDIVEDTYASSTTDSRRNSRFGGFPFPLDRCDRRAPLPPCYSNQNLDDFLGPDGLPLPKTKCPNEYTAISYYPTQHTRSLDNVSVGHKRLSMRLSVAMPSYAEHPDPPPPPQTQQNTAQPQTRPPLQNLRSYDGSSMVESDYGSCEEVMF